MHRASPTLLAGVLAATTCLAVALIGAVPASADDDATIPPPVLLSPSPTPSETTGAETTDAEAVPTESPTDEPSAIGPAPATSASPSPSAAEVLLSVNLAMPATVAATTRQPALPRTRLPLKQGHFGAKVARVQERLTWLGYDLAPSNIERAAFGASTVAAVKHFQTKNWLPATGKVDERTWRMLRKHAEPLNILPLRCTEVKAALCIDKTTKTLRYVVKGKVTLVTDARFGAPGMETDEGIFSVKEKSYNHVSSIYRTWMPRAMFFNGDEAVHYSPDFNAVGYLRGSHGCVGIRDIDVATRLFNKVDVGTRVYVYWS